MWVGTEWGEDLQSEDSWGFPSSLCLNFALVRRWSPSLMDSSAWHLLLERAVRSNCCTWLSARRAMECYQMLPTSAESEGCTCVYVSMLWNWKSKMNQWVTTHISLGAGGSCPLCSEQVGHQDVKTFVWSPALWPWIGYSSVHF